MQSEQVKSNGAAVTEAAPSLLDSIVERQAERQAEIASRYKPVMSIGEAIQRHRELAQFIREILVEGEDYGKIPGTDTKPVLLKPGAEKLCAFFGYAPVYTVTDIEDWMGNRFSEPLFYYRYTCTLMKDGAPVGSGEGSANTWESKYRWRWVPESSLPSGTDKATLATRGGAVTEFDFAIEKGETGGQYGKPAEYWAKWRKAIESGMARSVDKTSKAGKKLKAWEMDDSHSAPGQRVCPPISQKAVDDGRSLPFYDVESHYSIARTVCSTPCDSTVLMVFMLTTVATRTSGCVYDVETAPAPPIQKASIENIRLDHSP